MAIAGLSSASYASGGSNRFWAAALGPGAAPRVAPPSRTQSAAPAAPVSPAEPAEPQTSTAYQTNADGDSVTLSSREGQLTDAEKRQVEKLRQRDNEVRTHEMAHVAAAGPLHRSGPHYTYTTGPDGKRYATGGHVNIDTSRGKTPEETIRKAQQVRRAALAPAEPSSTDRAVATEAARMEAEAQRELAQERAAGKPASQPADAASTRDPAAATGSSKRTSADPAAPSASSKGFTGVTVDLLA